MEARDNPKEFSFYRGESKSPQSEILSAWASVLTGPALNDYMRGKWAPKATETWTNKNKTGFKTGFSKGGKQVTTSEVINA